MVCTHEGTLLVMCGDTWRLGVLAGTTPEFKAPRLIMDRFPSSRHGSPHATQRLGNGACSSGRSPPPTPELGFSSHPRTGPCVGYNLYSPQVGWSAL